MRNNGGFATFGQLYSLLDFSGWDTQTPEASVRRIVQDSPELFFKIERGLWALEECRESVLKKFKLEGFKEFDSPIPDEAVAERKQEFTHSFYQGLIVEIGNMKRKKTFVPNADRKKLFLGKPLQEIVTLESIHDFTYPEYLKRAKTVDVIWFNERRLPSAFFEVEHTTNIEHSLLKFLVLQDYHAAFFIVAEEERRRQFDALLGTHTFEPLLKRVKFQNYAHLTKQHENMSELEKIDTI
jgi:hypothetical protein